MSDLSEKQWQEYLAKEERDVLWRAYSDIRSVQAACAIIKQDDIRTECENLAVKIEEHLRILYEKTYEEKK